MGKNVALGLTLLALGGGLAACGGSEEGVASNGPVAKVPPSSSAKRRETASGCAARGITVPPYREGTCTQDGRPWVIVNGRSVLKLRTLSLALRGFDIAEQEGHGANVITPQQGAFVAITVRVQNMTRTPQEVVPHQTALEVEGQRFEERGEVEKVDRRALGYARRAPIPPGQSTEGELIYDVPLALLQKVTSTGQLFVANFGETGSHAQIGAIRIFLA